MKKKIINWQPSTSQVVNENTPLLMDSQPSTSQVINKIIQSQPRLNENIILLINSSNEIQNYSLIEETNNSQNEKTLCDYFGEIMQEIMSCETECYPEFCNSFCSSL